MRRYPLNQSILSTMTDQYFVTVANILNLNSPFKRELLIREFGCRDFFFNSPYSKIPMCKILFLFFFSIQECCKFVQVTCLKKLSARDLRNDTSNNTTNVDLNLTLLYQYE